MSSSWRTAKYIACGVPSFFLLAAFLVFLGYVVYSLHIFVAPPPQLNINCELMNHKEELQKYLNKKMTLNITEEALGPADRCWAIKKKWHMPFEIPDSMEVHHALYLIRVVSKDYQFFEEVLAMMFSPIHFYCFPIDSNSTIEFEEKVRFMGRCVINVIVPEGVFDSKNSTDLFRAHTRCFEEMDGFAWKHVVVNQENEIPLQSIHYLADRLRRLGVGSKIGTELISVEQTRILNAPNNTFTEAVKDYVQNATCKWLGGKREPLFISRDFVQTFYSLALEGMTLEEKDKCQRTLQPRTRKNHICLSGRFDSDGNCILGMEDYAYSKSTRHLFVRADPNFDLGFVQCVHDFVFKRTYNTSFYNIRYGSY